ncbi:MAG: hypothetical protein Q4E53_13250 [Eubacteriales bacterium]|nr:hypothetical protein [Eubacteriales bacterium]
MRRFRIFTIILFIISVLSFVGYRYYTKGQRDTLPPTLTVPRTPLQVSVDAEEAELLEGVTAIDKVDGDLTKEVMIESIGPFDEEKNRTIIYVVLDHAGNIARATRQLTYKNYRSPRFSLESPLIYGFTMNSSNITDVIEAEDIFDGDISGRVKISSKYHLKNDPGEYPMEFTVTNSIGDTASFTATITMPDLNDALSRASITLSDYLVYVKKGKNIDPWKYVDGITIGNRTYVRDGDRLVPENELESHADSYSKTIEESDVKIKNPVKIKKPGCYEIKYSYKEDEEKTSVYLVVIVR